MTVRIALPCLTLGLVLSVSACSKDDQKILVDKVVDAAADASAMPAAPKNLDLAKAALATARAKFAKHEAVEADCTPLESFERDFADSTDPDAVKTTRGIDTFCGIDVRLDGAVQTLKTDSAKVADAVKKKDHTTEQIYSSTVRDSCASIHDQLDALTAKHLDTDPKVTMLKADIDPICSPAPAKKK